MSQPRRYIGKAIIYPPNPDNLYDVEAVEDANGDWVSWEDYEKLQAENEKLRFASKCDIPKLYSQINFVDKKWEVVRLGAKDDVEDNGEKCVRVTITLIETK